MMGWFFALIKIW